MYRNADSREVRRALPAAAALLAASLGLATAGADTPRQGEPARVRATEVAQIDLREAGIDGALDSLREASRTADPEGVGINIVYQGPPADQVPRITLRLRNVSLYDALRYVTELSGLRFRIDERAVVVTSADAPSGRVITRFYPVQPAFLDVIREKERQEDPAPRPFYFSR